MTYRMCPNAVHFKEFQNDQVTGHHYTATCGETMLATMMVCSTHQVETVAQAISLMESITRTMMAEHLADAPNGASRMSGLHQYAVDKGFVIDPGSYISFQQPLPSTTLHELLLSTAGIKPIGIEIARAGAGLPGDEKGVQYHYICIVGISDAGYICNDGDNWQITQELITYTWADIEAAVPCAVMVMELQEGALNVGIPQGWTDDGKTMTATNKLVVTQGFRDYILNHPWDANNLPIENVVGVSEVEEFNTSHGAGTIQRFHFSQLSWTAQSGVFATYIGDEAKFLRAALDAANAQIATLKHQPAPAPIPVPVPTPIDPSIKTALSAALNLLQPQAALADEIKTAIAALSK